MLSKTLLYILITLIIIGNNLWAIANINSIPASSYEHPTLLIHDVSPYYFDYIKEII